MPEGVERRPCAHEWRQTYAKTLPREREGLGRPECKLCGGMPSFFELREFEQGSRELEGALKHGMYVPCERASGGRPT
jgi:hypothetical protein